MKGYFLSSVQNTNDLVIYDNNVSMNYLDFYQGNPVTLVSPLIYYAPKQNLKKIKTSVLINSSGPLIVNTYLKEILELNTDNVQFFDIELICNKESIHGFYAINVLCKKNALTWIIVNFV